MLCHGTGTKLLVGAQLCGSVQPQRPEWVGSLPLPQPTSVSGSVHHVFGIIARVYGYGQLSLFTRLINLISLICWLGAESGQIGPIGDVPQREAALSGAVKMQGAVRIRSQRADVLARPGELPH